MSKDERRVPELRFKGFYDDWEQRKLGDLVERVTRKNKRNTSNLPLTISAQDGLVDQNTYFKKQVASRDMSNYYLLKKGDFAYNKSYSNGFPLGVVKRLDNYEYGALSTLYIVFRPTQVNSTFLVSYYETNKWHREVSRRSAEGARNHGLLNLSVTDFFDAELKIPVLDSEQIKIGVLIKKLENNINLHQQKINILKRLKQVYLSLMFPENNKNIPLLRFKDFKEEWEQRKLGEMGTVLTGNTPSTKNESYWDSNSGNVWITPTDINKLKTARSERNLSDLGWKSARVVPTNSVMITSIASIGKNTINKVPAAFNQQINAIIPNNSHNYFILSYMEKTKRRFTAIAGKTATSIINKSDFQKFPIKSPSFEEQSRIGIMFETIDEVINLHQSSMNKLENLKRIFLYKMFL